MESVGVQVARTNEYRVIGPPGTGKTTYLCKQIEAALQACQERTGISPSDSRDVLVCSLTKAAANELKQRGLDIHPEQIATLHAHALRAIGRPALCVDGEPLLEWGQHCDAIGKPEWKLSGKTVSDREDLDRLQSSEWEGAQGDNWLADYHRYRSRLVPRSEWTMHVTAFATEYENWKKENEYRDFSDVIEEAYLLTDSAPYCPSVLLVDEAQDNDRAELRLIRKWGRNCERVVIVGDPDQNLYQWRGSDPEAFDDPDLPLPPENYRVLKQSYRVPRAVHAQAQRMIRRIRKRKDWEYFPRDADGQVVHDGESFTNSWKASYAVNEMLPYLQAGKRIMFLASCGYMLNALAKTLREEGIPFWNPFARERGGFNPLHPSRGIPAGRRLANYLLPHEKYYGGEARLWTWSELHTWVDVCRAEGVLRHGMKAEIARKGKEEDGQLSPADALECFEDGLLEKMDSDPLGVLVGLVRKDRSSAMEFAIRIVKRRGLIDLERTPQIILGTIHSVKGGEADVVFLSPDLSRRGHDRYEGKGADEICRLFYVGMTRSRETLVLCNAGSPMTSIDW